MNYLKEHMAKTKRNCDNCSNEYFADNRNLNRGVHDSCSTEARRAQTT